MNYCNICFQTFIAMLYCHLREFESVFAFPSLDDLRPLVADAKNHFTLGRSMVQGLLPYSMAERHFASQTPSFIAPLSGRQLHNKIHPPPSRSRATNDKRRSFFVLTDRKNSLFVVGRAFASANT